MRSNSQSQHDYALNPVQSIPRSSFNRSHGVKTAFDFGMCVPIGCWEVLPGDTINLKLHHVARLATPLFPVMDNMFLDFHFWFVSYRILWENFVRMMGAQDNPGDSTSFVMPETTSPGPSGYGTGSLQDYMGLPPRKAGITHQVLPLRAYNLIWNEWYRDQDLQDSVTVLKDDGPDAWDEYLLLPRGKRHDYFTAARPFVQKGPSVQLPLGSTAPVTVTGTPTFTDGTTGNRRLIYGGTNIVGYEGAIPPPTFYLDWDDPGLETNLGAANAASINEMRNAVAIQHLYEKDARGGTRYVEVLRQHFGVILPDLQWRPVYLGGGTRLMNVSQVPQTSSTDVTTPQGNLAAYGVSAGGPVGMSQSFNEHGVVIAIVSGRADLNYQQGLPRMWSRSSRWDFYWPDLAHIGEQSILSKEIYADGSSADDDVFGYTERYGEYKYQPSLITGRMRSTALQTLDPWHVAQEFSTRPVLDETFIVEDPAIDRAIAVPSQPHIIFDGYYQFNHVRPMGVYSVPGLLRF